MDSPLVLQPHQGIPVCRDALLLAGGEQATSPVSRGLDIHPTHVRLNIVNRAITHAHVRPQVEQLGEGELPLQAINVYLQAILRTYPLVLEVVLA